MTVLDTSAVVDFLLGEEAFEEVEALLAREGTGAVPDLVVFEVLAVLRRLVHQGGLSADRAGAAVADLGDVPLDYFPTLPLRGRAWELRESLTAADALFLALAEGLGEPLATKDTGLTAAARRGGVEVVKLGGPGSDPGR